MPGLNPKNGTEKVRPETHLSRRCGILRNLGESAHRLFGLTWIGDIYRVLWSAARGSASTIYHGSEICKCGSSRVGA
jgi:hypothetical protein